MYSSISTNSLLLNNVTITFTIFNEFDTVQIQVTRPPAVTLNSSNDGKDDLIGVLRNNHIKGSA